MANKRMNPIRKWTSQTLLCGGLLAFGSGLILRHSNWIYYGFQAAMAGLAVGVCRYVCPQCGKKHVSVGADLKHCTSCGASMFDESDMPLPPA